MRHSYVDARPSGTPRSDESLVLPDGRRLQVAFWGVPGGVPALLLHGTPGSRLFCPDLAATERAGVDLITFDRAGYGRSDPATGVASYRSSADDVVALLDQLGIQQLAVIGWSGGGPHAMALGALAPERVTSVATVCSPSNSGGAIGDDPVVRSLNEEVLKDPAGARELVRDRARNVLDDGSWVTRMIDRYDPTLFDAPAMRDVYPPSWDEATVRSFEGYVDDWILGTLPWDFEISDVDAPVSVWYGESDAQVAPEHAHAIAERAPNSELLGCSECRHFLAVAHWPGILDRALVH